MENKEVWKDGDILINKKMFRFCVFSDFDNCGSYFATTLSVDKGDYDYYEDGVDFMETKDYRLATSEEVKYFHELLHKYGKDWDEENKTLIHYQWKPQFREKYYIVTAAFHVSTETYIDDDIDNMLIAVGNCFKTKEEALEKAKKIKEVFNRL